MEFLKKNWIWIVVAVLGIYLYLNYTKRKKAEDTAIALFNKFNARAATNLNTAEEKKSLIKLIDTASDKERQLFADLMNGAIANFAAAEQERDKGKAKSDFAANMNKMQNDLIAKYGRENVMKFKAKMDRYGFVI